MIASWLQTIILAMIGAALPFGTVLASGGDVSWKIVVASIVTAGLAAIANVLRSPKENPPTMIKKAGTDG